MTNIKPRELTCCFTGHRPTKLPWGFDEKDPRCEALRERIFDVAEAFYRSGITHFICGMAQGCDMYFCEEIIKLREEHPEITLEAAIPCEAQAERWPEQERGRYFRLVSQCDNMHLIQKDYSRECMIKRNKYMVDKSSVLIAVYDGAFGGTMQTVQYAKKKLLEIVQIDPTVSL